MSLSIFNTFKKLLQLALCLSALNSLFILTNSHDVKAQINKEQGAITERPYKPGTIAIAASGYRAGQAVFKALEAAEKISEGSIGGIAIFYAMTRDGKIHIYSNNGRGGTSTLFIDGEKTGVPPPPEIAEARLAGVISTGPREPYTIAGGKLTYPWFGDGIGFVVGHRIPAHKGNDGLPVNHAVFKRMEQGESAREAVEAVMRNNPDVDAGLIAVDAEGHVAMFNSQKVDKRYDYGHARGEDRPSGAVVETILNEIHPHQAVAKLVVDKALAIMSERLKPDLQITLRAGIQLEYGPENLVEVNSDLVVTRVVTTELSYLEGNHWQAIPYILSRVVQDGKTLGFTTVEALGHLEDGIIESVSTQEEMKIWIKKEPRRCDNETPSLTICQSLKIE